MLVDVFIVEQDWGGAASPGVSSWSLRKELNAVMAASVIDYMEPKRSRANSVSSLFMGNLSS